MAPFHDLETLRYFTDAGGQSRPAGHKPQELSLLLICEGHECLPQPLDHLVVLVDTVTISEGAVEGGQQGNIEGKKWRNIERGQWGGQCRNIGGGQQGNIGGGQQGNIGGGVVGEHWRGVVEKHWRGQGTGDDSEWNGEVYIFKHQKFHKKAVNFLLVLKLSLSKIKYIYSNVILRKYNSL